jgi:hypothetical protein
VRNDLCARGAGRAGYRGFERGRYRVDAENGRRRGRSEYAALLSANGQQFQQLSAEAAAFHDKFVQNLIASANKYATAEANAAQSLSGSALGPALSSMLGGGAAVKALTCTDGRIHSANSRQWGVSERPDQRCRGGVGGPVTRTTATLITGTTG